jgi:hypothetical protein
MIDLDALCIAHSYRHAFSIPPWGWAPQNAGVVDAPSLSGWAASAKLASSVEFA